VAKYTCTICGYVYDEAKGIPEKGIAPGTVWEELPAEWVCPLCGATKAEFKKEGAEAAKAAAPVRKLEQKELKELSALELSAICSNLARGCEKQYRNEESELFKQLADWFKSAAPEEEGDYSDLLALVDSDLETGYPETNAVTAAAHDRGAMRVLVWGEKVTRIQRSLLSRYAKEGEKMLENTGVWVCTICGFIHIGDTAPDICPVCKVPDWKFEKM